MTAALIAPFTKGIDKHLINEYRMWEPQHTQIFHMDGTKFRYVDHQNYQMYPKPSFRIPGQRVKQESFYQSFGKRFIIRGFGLADSVPREDWDDDLYGVFNRVLPSKGGAMARAFVDLKEYETANYFANLGFASGTSIAGSFDGVSLFNTSHPLSLQNSTILAANRPSLDVDLSIASWQGAITNLRTQVAENNITYLSNKPRVLVVNPQLEFIAKQILRGDWVPYSADRTLNVAGKDYPVNLVCWPYFTKSGSQGTNNAWFTVGEQHELHFIQRSPPQTDTDYDVNTKSMIWATDERFDYGHSDWRGTYGSTGS